MKIKHFFFALLTIIVCFYIFKNYAYSVKDQFCFTTKVSSKIYDFNSFNLKVHPSLNINDFKVLNKNNGNIIFENGKSRKGIQNDYGHRIFVLYFKNKEIVEMGHFIYNSWITNDYILKLDSKMNSTLEITGKNATYSDLYYNKFNDN